MWALDFLSGDSIDSNTFQLPCDYLERTSFSDCLLRHLSALPSGSFASVQGSWGTGKTFVLASAYRSVLVGENNSFAQRPIWINPWQYGASDVLTPLILKLAMRLSPNQKTDRPGVIRKILSTLVRASAAFAHKTGAYFASLNGDVITAGILESSANSIDAVLASLFDTLDLQQQHSTQRDADPDVMAAMSGRFSELVDLVLADESAEDASKRLLVVVDDLDRCLPETQLSFLESLRFLSGNETRVVFLIGIDPLLAHCAIGSRYGDRLSEPDLYLDKIFTVRFTIPPLEGRDVQRLIDGRLSEPVGQSGQQLRIHLAALFGKRVDSLGSVLLDAWSTPALRNPRVIDRVLLRLALASHSTSAELLEAASNDVKFRILLTWLGIAIRWPSVRNVLRTCPESFRSERWLEIISFCTRGNQSHSAAVKLIPHSDDLSETLSSMSQYAERNGMTPDILPHMLYEFDVRMIASGL